jgi:hypothetical protein
MHLEHYVNSGSSDNEKVKFQNNKTDIHIEILYFIYHCLDRELYKLAGAQKRSEILDRIIPFALSDLSTMYGLNNSVSTRIYDNINAKQIEYAQYGSIVTDDLFGHSAVTHIAKRLTHILNGGISVQMPFTLFFTKTYSSLLVTLILLSHTENEKAISWDLSAIASDEQLKVLEKLSSANFF